MGLSRHFFLISGILTLVLVGCGGGGGSSPAVGRFAGHYTGTYTSTTTDAHGTLDVSVSADGTVTGTVSDSRYVAEGVVVDGSHIDHSGNVTLITRYGAGDVALTTTATGVVDLAGDELVGTLNEAQGDVTESFSLSLTRG